MNTLTRLFLSSEYFINASQTPITKVINMWWKYLSIGLVSYVIAAGLLIPLGPGISEAKPTVIVTAEPVTLDLTGYNTFFKKEESHQTAQILLNATTAVCADAIEVLDDEHMKVTFEIPHGQLPIDSTVNGKNKRSPFPILEVYSPKAGKASMQSLVVRVSGKDSSNGKFCSVAEYPAAKGLSFPYLGVLAETSRNLFYHVPLWFSMMILMAGSVYCSFRYLKTNDLEHDRRATSLALVGTIYGVLGCATGAMWARHTWGAYWPNDVKLNMAAVAVLIYLAFFVLRSSFDDQAKKARLSAVYNVFAFASLIPLLFVIPRLTESLHPGNGGNPAFGSYDLDSTMRMVFYPAIIGWALLGVWMAELWLRYERVKEFWLDQEENKS